MMAPGSRAIMIYGLIEKITMNATIKTIPFLTLSFFEIKNS